MPVPQVSPRPASLSSAPTVLLVGTDRMDDAVRQALIRRDVHVELCPVEVVPQTVMVAAPDLVVLLGDAAEKGGVAVLSKLREHPVTATAAVAVLSAADKLDDRLAAFRHGAVAAIPRSASADDIGARILRLVQEVPDRSGAVSGELGEATLDELTELVRRELRSGILSVEGETGDPVRIVFGAGKPVTEALQEFVEKLRPLVQRTEQVRFELLEEPGSRLQLSEFPPAFAPDMAVFRNLSVLLVDNNSGRADALAQGLRGAGATVVIIGSSNSDLSRTRGLDPDLVIFDQEALAGPDFDLVRHLRQDLRLRWAALLLADWQTLWPDRSLPVDLGRLSSSVSPLVEGARELEGRVKNEEVFDTRLENTGPSRLLRILVRTGKTFHVVVHGARATIELDVADGLLVGALGTQSDGPPLEGVRALSGLLALSSARIHVEQRDNPTTANIMAPLEVALGAAMSEKLPLLPSVLPHRGQDAYLDTVAPPEAMPPPRPVPPPQVPFGGRTLAGMPPAPGAKTPAKGIPAIPKEARRADESGPLHPEASMVPFRAPAGDARDASWEGESALPPELQPPAKPLAPRESMGGARPGLHKIADGSLEPPASYQERADTDIEDLTSLEGLESEPPTSKHERLPDLAEVLEAEDEPVAAQAPAPPTPPVRPAPVAEEPLRVPGMVSRRVWMSRLAWAIAAVAVVALGAVVTVVASRLVGGGEIKAPEASATRDTTEVAPEPAEGPVGEVEEAAPEAVDTEPAAVALPEAPVIAPDPPAASTEDLAEAPPVTGTVDPSRSPGSLIREAERLVRQDEVLAAGPLFERALELAPRDNHALIGMAQVRLAQGDAERAIPLAEQAVALRSRRNPYRIVLADAYRGAGRDADARREYNRVLRSEPRNKPALVGMDALRGIE